MNTEQAKEILRLYRPGSSDEREPEMTAALAQTRRDPELASWFEQHRAFNETFRQRLQQITPPADLKNQILANHLRSRVIVWWKRPEFLAAAAVLVMLVCLAAFWLAPQPANGLAEFRLRMAKTALRPYNMDLVTNDLAQIRTFLARTGAPADYALTPPLKQLAAVGCARLKWDNHPISMICFQLKKNSLLWLFVAEGGVFHQVPNLPKPELQPVGKMMTATWTNQGKTYLLAVVGDKTLIEKYL